MADIVALRRGTGSGAGPGRLAPPFTDPPAALTGPRVQPMPPAGPGPAGPGPAGLASAGAAAERAAGVLRAVGTDQLATASAFPGRRGGARVLPVRPELRGLLPDRGLRRGGTLAVPRRAGSTSLLLSLLAPAAAEGAWCALVGMPDLGLLAAAEFGLPLDRLALVGYPGPEWTTVVAALLDGFDVVAVAPPGPVAAAVTGRLAARARQRAGVLIGHGGWSGADLVLDAVASTWSGLGAGRGRLTQHQLTVAARGRGAAARPRQVTFAVTMPSGPVGAAGPAGWAGPVAAAEAVGA